MGAPPRAEVTDLRLGIQFCLAYLPVMVAEAKGYFAEEAAKCRLIPLPDRSEFAAMLSRYQLARPALDTIRGVLALPMKPL